MSNPLLQTDGLPAYDKITPEHVGPAVEAIKKEFETLLTQAEESTDWDSLKVPMGKLDLLFEYGWSPISHLLGVANSDELRDAHEAVIPQVIGMVLQLGQSKPLYERYCAFRDSEDWASMPSEKKRIVEKAILAAQQSGIGLDGADLERFNEIAERLSQVGTEFSNNVLDATNAWHLDITDSADAEGFPDSYRRVAAGNYAAGQEEATEPDAEKGPWRVKLDGPRFTPFIQHCRNRELREKAYRAYVTRASAGEHDNTPLIDDILKLRKEQSQLLGYQNFAENSLANKMAGNTDEIQQMFDQLLGASLEAGKLELEEVTRFANDNGHEGELAHWDVGFWAERLREHKYAYTEEELRPYFSLERVLSGLFDLCTKLFGVTFKEADGEAPIWNDDVRFFHVLGEDNARIASFYLDPYSRPENKRPGAWMADCVGRPVTST